MCDLVSAYRFLHRPAFPMHPSCILFCATFWSTLRSLPAAWIVVWIGLVALSIALIVLMRTQWGQSKPLQKCAVLSLLAHVLLGCLATTIKIVHDTAGQAESNVTRVTFTSGEDWSNQGTSLSDGAAEQDWDSAVEQSVEPPAQPPERRLADDHEIQERRLASPELSAGLEPSTARDLHPQPDGDAQSSDAKAAQAASPASRIDAPQAAQRSVEPVDASLPSAEQPAPQSIDAAIHPQRNSTTPTRQRDFTPESSMADLLPSPQPAELAAGAMDLPRRNVSPVPAPATLASPPQSTDEKQVSSATDDAGKLVEVPQGRSPHADPLRDGGTPNASSADKGSAEAQRRHNLPTLYQQRFAHDRMELVRKYGGGEDTEAAVEAALRWLAANQSAGGHWDADHHGAGKEERVHGHDRMGAGVRADTGITGLALLAFLGAGHTHLEGIYKGHVARGLNFLAQKQAENGNLAGDASLFARMYCHGMATLALGECYVMTGDERLLPPLKAAVAYSVAAQRPAGGGWRYQPGDLGDTSQLGWQLMALKSADVAGVAIPGETRMRMVRFLAGVKAGQNGGLASYQPLRPVSRAMTAEAMFCRQLLGEPIPRRAADEAAAFLLGETPGRGKANYYYWYYATLCLYQMQGEAWNRWNADLRPTLVALQEIQGPAAGSWPTSSVWGGYGGRVYTTAMAAMCLETYYRYLPIYLEQARTTRLVR